MPVAASLPDPLKIETTSNNATMIPVQIIRFRASGLPLGSCSSFMACLVLFGQSCQCRSQKVNGNISLSL